MAGPNGCIWMFRIRTHMIGMTVFRARYLQADIEPPDSPDMTPQQTLCQQMELLRPDYININPAIMSPELKPDEIYVSDYRNYDYIERDN